VIANLIALLRANPGGLDAQGIRAGMGWPAHRQVNPYVTWARQHLRRTGSGETIPYLRVTGGDLYRIVNVIDAAGWEAGDTQRKGARTVCLELEAEWSREHDRLLALGQTVEAYQAFANSQQFANAAALL
jgi:hypothetical protein